MQKILIAAVSANGIIGREGTIPWHSRAELKNFKSITMGYPIIMGRKTYESIGKPLPGRLNIVISRNREFNPGFSEIRVFGSLEEAYIYCIREANPEKVFIIGGGELYRQSIKDADKLIISQMNLEAEGDVYFPEISPEIWEEENAVSYDEFIVRTYKRKL